MIIYEADHRTMNANGLWGMGIAFAVAANCLACLLLLPTSFWSEELQQKETATSALYWDGSRKASVSTGSLDHEREDDRGMMLIASL